MKINYKTEFDLYLRLQGLERPNITNLETLLHKLNQPNEVREFLSWNPQVCALIFDYLRDNEMVDPASLKQANDNVLMENGCK